MDRHRRGHWEEPTASILEQREAVATGFDGCLQEDAHEVSDGNVEAKHDQGIEACHGYGRALGDCEGDIV
jgi:hypothetical protein